MRKQSLFFGLIFAFLGLTAQAQIYEVYHQGFESGETVSYTVTGTNSTQATIHNGGGQAMQLQHNSTSAVVIEFDTIDCTNNSTLQYISLEFAHICNADPNNNESATSVAIIQVKRPDQTTWTRLTSAHYNMSNGGSTDFNAGAGSFSNRSYSEWQGSTISNAWWKQERFDLNSFFRAVAANQKKLQIKMTLGKRSGSTANASWYLDDISVKASPSAMVSPNIKMIAFPDMLNYPSSRGAKVTADITTTVTQGMCADSIYLVYKIGSDNTQHRLQMTAVPGVTNRYTARIPFCGYDTMMYFHLYAKDNSTNHNGSGYPTSSDAWVAYRCVRGTQNQNALATSLSNTADLPFPAFGDARSEFVYDSATLANAGYKAGAITSLDYMIQQAASQQVRENFTILMSNVEPSHTTSTTFEFVNDGLLPVYSGTYVIQPSTANTLQTINFQDTFFYAGKDILMQVIYNNSEYTTPVNPVATTIKAFPTATGKKSLYMGMSAMIGYSPYTDPDFMYGQESSVRPHFMFNAKKNEPLLFDCGVSLIHTPSPTNAAQASTNQQVKVYLKNFGAQPIHAVPIYYRLDNNTPVTYNWTGNLAGGDSVMVTLSTTQQYTAGYHTITAWVDDTVARSGVRYRDHEPYNDTAWTEFIACAGPLSGTRQVGGTGADYAGMEELLFGLSSCGINGQLTIKIAPGTYAPFVMPQINGLTAAHYIQFEPLTDSGTVFFSNVGNTSSTIVDMQSTSDIRFHNIVFRVEENGLTEAVRMSTTSNRGQFLNCAFVASAGVVVPKMINTGGASNLMIDGCSFVGGTIAVDLSGVASDNRATTNTVQNNNFRNQLEEAVRVVNQTSAVVKGNYMNDVTSNASYVIYLKHCYGATRIEQNKVYTTHGACGIGMSEIHGTASQYVVIANNMITSEDDGTSNQLTTALNVISCDYTKVVYNTVKMRSPDKVGIAAATFGGATITNSWFVNNFITCFDETNYAFSYIPGTATSNQLHHNAYYSRSEVLNRCAGTNYTSLAAWQAAVPADNSSRVVTPGFIGGTPVDLRTYNTAIKGWGVPITEVPVDHFNTSRSTTGTCVGAFEFDALHYDFSIDEVLSPADEYCAAPDSIEVVVRVRNSGIDAYIPGTTAAATMIVSCGTQSLIFNVDDTLVANGTTVYHTGRYLSLPPNGREDNIYQIRAIISASFDPNSTNDTIDFLVRSNYHGTAIPTFTHNSGYAASANISLPASSLDQWNTHIYNAGRKGTSTVYWYADSLATDPIHRGNTYNTGALYADTSFYVEQRRELEMLRITEVQISRTAPGATNPMPSWMGTSTAFAVELTNVGDYPAHANGDTVQIVSDNNTFNNKYFVLPDVVVQPGESFVLQFRTSNTNPAPYYTAYWTSSLSPTYNTNFGVVYRDGSGIQDAVIFKDMHTKTQWTSLNVPQYIWKGNAIAMPTTNNTTAGVKRTSWPSNPTAPISNTATYWTVCDATNVMHIGTPEENLRQYQSNGCPGERSRVDVQLINVPSVDIALDSLEVGEGCGLGNEPISVTVHNYGILTSSPIVVKLKVGATEVCADTVSAGMAPQTAVHHTFSSLVNMRANSDTVFNLTAFAVAATGEYNTANDTTRSAVVSRYTPLSPAVAMPRSVNYGSRDTIVAQSAAIDSLIWYDRNMQPLDTGNVFVTPVLYDNDTFFVTASGHVYPTFHVGDLATQSTATAYPSPYNPNKKLAREQYIYTAHDLRQAGHTAGTITALSFYLDTIPSAAGSVSFTQYQIKIGTTPDTLFASASAWKSINQVVYNRATTVTNAQKGWIRHELSTPFVWDGTSSIVIEFNRALSAAITSGARTRYTRTNQNSCLTKADNNATTGNGSLSKNRPDAVFEFVDYGCTSNPTQVVVDVIGVPAEDAALSWTDDSTFTSCGISNIRVVLENRGNSTLSNYTIDYWIDGVANTYTGNTPMPAHSSQTLTLNSVHFTPGRHTVRIIANAVNDNINTNDTLETFINARFCPGTYTIGQGLDYPNFTVAVDSLVNAGIDGPVVFSVASGTYNEQVQIGAVDGMSDTNTVTFQSATGNASDVVLRYATTQAANYVLRIANNASDLSIKDMTIYAAPTGTGAAGNYANAVAISNASRITLNNATVRVKGTVNNVNANCIVVDENVDRLTIVNSVIDSGYCGIDGIVPVDMRSSNYVIANNEITNFWSQGISLRRVDTVAIQGNQITSGVNIANRALNGIRLAESNGAFVVEKNKIYLIDNKNGGKRGIQIARCAATNLMRNRIYNNMVSVSGTGVNSQTSSGIWIDSSSTYVNVYYNSVRVYAGVNAATTHAMHVGTACAHNYVMNNIFSNFSKGYAYYVMVDTNVTTSNYNVYYSDTSATNHKLTYWGRDAANLNALCALNGQDANSLYQQVYFLGVDDLHLAIGQFAEKSQYNPEVPDDIDGVVRLQPRSTIGADEYLQVAHDLAMVEVITPSLEVDDNVETFLSRVRVRYFNNGNAIETNARWRAEIKGVSGSTSAWKTIQTIAPSDFQSDSTDLTLPLGIIDTQTIVVYVSLTNDGESNNDTIEQKFYINPAFNLQAVSVSADDGCELRNAEVSITLKNVGLAQIPTGVPFTISYTAVLKSGATSIPNLPISVTETISLDEPLAVQASVTKVFAQKANLYPTNTYNKIQINLQGSVRYQYDLRTENDQTPLKVVNSYYTPSSPMADDLHIPYATWSAIRASQAQNRVVHWFNDTNAAFFYNGNNNYAASCTWNGGPQYFRDTVYYLNCKSHDGGECPSLFSAVHVYLNPRVPIDVAATAVNQPGRKTYVIDDTATVTITNHGTSGVSNIPVVFQLWNSTRSQLLQELTQTCTATVPAGGTYLFKFDSLLHINSPDANTTFYVRTWTDLSTDQVHLNDTLRTDYRFETLTERDYCTPSITASEGIDIVRVSYNTLNHEMPASGWTYKNFGVFSNPEVPVLHLQRGTLDTFYITTVNNTNDLDFNTRVRLSVYLDNDRSGEIKLAERLATAISVANATTMLVCRIPETTSFGYTKLRVIADADTMHRDGLCVFDNPGDDYDDATANGQVQDFLVYINEHLPEYDLAVSRIVLPASNILTTDTNQISVVLANKGSRPIDTIALSYSYVTSENGHDTNIVTGTKTWTGSVAPGDNVCITLNKRCFALGTTLFRLTATTPHDADLSNNSIEKEFHRFHTVTLVMNDNFDDNNIWYAPRGYNGYTHNYWELGTPTKRNLSTTYSEPRAWATDLVAPVTSGKYGTLSYLYSPIVNIALIRPDTLTFRLASNMTDGSQLTLEYRNFEGGWKKVEHTDVTTRWYNGEGAFTGSTSSFNYQEFRFPLNRISSEFPQNMQFRFVYRTLPGSGVNTSYGDGCVIDNFTVGRAARPIDVGVIAITEPTAPQFGQTVFPQVVIKNYGTDTVRSAAVEYRPWGSSLSRAGLYSGTIPPGGTDTYTFTNSFVVTNNFPDTFQICAYTAVNSDIYDDNDSLCQDFYLAPLENDLSSIEFVSPMSNVVAGDSVSVTLRIRNYGRQPIHTAKLTYIYNSAITVTEEVNFDDYLGADGLGEFEYFNYTFNQKFRAAIGLMTLKSYCRYEQDTYHLNDTIAMQFNGITVLSDLQAKEIVRDTSALTHTTIELVIANVGARAANDFEVGFWIDNDTTTKQVDIFHRENGLPALSNGYHVFAPLEQRSAPYTYICAYVHNLEDNDRSNDTTCLIVPQYVDIKVNKVLVEENREEDCRVRLEVENVGNMALTYAQQIRATINGESISALSSDTLEPGVVKTLDFDRTISKNPQRQYTGSGKLTSTRDINNANNETNVIEVRNYFSIPTVEATNGMVLMQNYPNPFKQSTRIDFYIPAGGEVRFFVMDELGRLIYQEVGKYDSGNQSIDFGSSLNASGSYYYGIEYDGQRLMQKMVFQR